MSIKIKSFLLAVVPAALVYWIAARFLGFTSTSIFPDVLKDVASGVPASLLVLFVVDLFVENLVGIGILAGIAVYLLVRFAAHAWMQAAIGFIAAETVIAYSLLWSSAALQDFSIIHSILLLPHLLAVSLCAFTAAYWGSKSRKKHLGYTQ